MTRQPEQIRAFRDTWELGIHSYLAYLRDRLIVARELLTETGSVFVQIGDENVHLVRCLLDEVFGVENSVALIRFRKKTMPLGAKNLESMCDYIIWYCKEINRLKFKHLYFEQDFAGDFHWNNYEMPDGSRHKINKKMIENGWTIPQNARRFRLVSLWPTSFNENAVFPVLFMGEEHYPAQGQCWPTSPQNMIRLIKANQIEVEGGYLRKVLYLEGANFSKITTDWMDTIGARDKSYVVETNEEVIKRCLLMTTDPGDLVLDPTCGSGTTAYVAEQWGRRWITLDTSRVALALARTRLMSGRYPYYLLADSQEGIRKEAEINGKMPPGYQTDGDIRKGFVYKRVPHITLKAIANNEEIDRIHERYQTELEPVRNQLNKLLKKNWQEWEIPRDSDEAWTDKVKELHKKWWELRRKRQKEIDASILRNADQELLVDQPYEDNKRIRVTGPFTFETLSPHRTISVQKKKELEEVGIEGWKVKVLGAGQFGNIIIENLRKAGVQNTIKNERLKFDRLETYAGSWIHAEGEYTEKDGKSRRVAVCIGPEHGTVGPELIKEAAKEAVQGIGFDLLIVCGFAFDPHVSEEVKRYGKLTILPTRMNADLSMGEELLKKTGAGNLFMVFGEPDIDVKKNKEGKITVEIKGLDVYDPTTGQIRNSSIDDIACWFIDTNYNGESFFVRHAYFTGGDKPYEKLQRVLKAEINEAAWTSLYSTVSRPFDKPETGKIAVKVINHYGDEVLKVFNI
jgi:adenine-specific DNA-methyltransferase